MANLKPEGISDRQRAVNAMQLRRDGKTWDEVADACGYADRSTAHRAVKRVLERVEGETVDDYREVVNARYEALYTKAWEAITSAEGKGQLVGRSQLVAAARGVLDSQAKLLGLGAPQKSELTVTTRAAVDDEISALVNKLRGSEPAPETQENQ
ncbi:hypothetical protein A5N78_04660 [Prescottella equi]|uniref:AraC family transcriptional regulator n=1 Tax=Rhodococcus hoagii TaxID=43767 RepID=UPI000A122EFA|nr:AraC family transcriptional regulator [Prescottella equi]ORL93430.1 hypothetical protein A5N78_04660 [Prescottella equi]ORM17783.1 hypothetical protein A5N70_11235 [Prescottella equi]